MSAPAPATPRAPRRAALLALCLFLFIWSAKLVVIDRFGSDLPFWDQWEKEGMHVLPAWFERHELLRPLFTPHNEHRIAPTLATNLALAALGGQWDARVQCLVSAALHAALFTGLFVWALRRLALPWAMAAGGFLAAVGAAPIVWENLLSGFQSQFYFLAGFSLLALSGLLENPALSRRWWLGLLSAALALVSMGSGFLCTLPILAVAALRLLNPVARRVSGGTAAPHRDTLLTLAAAALVLLTGLALHTSFPNHANLRATSLAQFLDYAFRCLSWPSPNLPWLAIILWAPWLLLALQLLQPKTLPSEATGWQITPRERLLLPCTNPKLKTWSPAPTPNSKPQTPNSSPAFLLAAGLWVLLQVAAVSFSRGGTGDFPANRYGDLCALGLAVNFLCFTRLAPRLPEPGPVAALWSLATLTAVALAAHTAWTVFLPSKHEEQAAHERHVRDFVRTDDFDALLREKENLPFPNAHSLAEILRRPSIRERLPASVGPHPQSPLSRSAQTLARQSPWLLATSTLAFLVLSFLSLRPHLSASRRLAASPSPRPPFPPPSALSAAPPAPEAPASGMKYFTLPTLLAALLLSALVVIPFLPATKITTHQFFLQGRATTSAPAVFQVYYDDGSGYQEKHSGRADIPAGSHRIFHIPLPRGAFTSFRLDPLEGSGTLTLSSLRVISQAGWTIAELPLRDLEPLQQISSLALTPAGLEVAVAPGSDDPQLLLPFDPPLVIDATWRDFRRSAWRVLPVFAAFALILFALDRAPRTRAALASRIQHLITRQPRAVALAAALAVVVSSYPVIFLGRSFVSPNYGTNLLYEHFPTLPGYTSPETVDAKMSDVGAIIWQHVPFSMMQRRALAEGELPLWNRYNANGVPLLAQGQSMFGDPLHFLVVAANGASWAWDLKYLLAKWLLATGLALTVLALLSAQPSPSAASRLTPLASSLLVALAAPFLGFFLYRLNHPAFFSLCYAPWPLYCLVRIAQSTTRRALAGWCAALLLANLALMNSGTVKEAYMLLLCVNFSGACILLTAPTQNPKLKTQNLFVRLAAVAWTGLLFTLLTTPIWATFLQTLKSAYTSYNAPAAYQIQPSLFLGFLDELFYRVVLEEDRVFNPSLNFLLGFGLLYFFATLRRQFADRAAVALLLSSLLPLSLAFGLVSPQLLTRLPLLANIAHVDNTFSCALLILWSILAGLGFATAFSRLGTREGRDDLLVCAALLFALVFAWIAFGHAAHRPIAGPAVTVNQVGRVIPVAPFIWGHLAALLAALAVFAIALHRWLARAPGTRTAAHALLLSTAAALLLWRHGQHASAVGYENFTHRPPARAPFHARSSAVDFVRAAHQREPARGYGIRSNFMPGWTGVYGLETVHGPDALMSPWLRELVDPSGVNRIWDWRLHCTPAEAAAARPFFDALNVRFYFDNQSNDPALADGLNLVHRADLDVYESPTAWPRAFFTDRLHVYDQPAELVQKIRAANGRPFAALQRPDLALDPRLASLIDDNPKLKTQNPKPHTAPATAYRLTENATTFRLRAPGPGVIVLTEAYWPGDSRAELNGRRVPVFRANHAFRAILVDAPGDYTVRFYYWPRNFVRYLTFSALGAVLIAASLALAFRPFRTPRHAVPSPGPRSPASAA